MRTHFPAASPRPIRALLLALVAALALTACGPEIHIERVSRDGEDGAGGGRRGGEIHALSLGPVSTWDPQRIASREEMHFAGRLFVRTLTAFPPATDVAGQSRLVGDLATDTGRPSKTLKSWTFTLRDDATWEDGSPVTCEDVRYGISRSFATKDLAGGPTYALAYLDVPKKADGSSTYAGPYVTGTDAKAGQKAYDKAVSCKGDVLTIKLGEPVSDFNEMVSLPAFAPVKKDHDSAKRSPFAIFSNGPYRLQGEWRASSGGTFVRNPKWLASSDPVRRAYPDKIRYVEGIEPQTMAQLIMADGAEGRVGVSLDPAPPALRQQITGMEDLERRSANPLSTIVDYLAPNHRNGVFKDPEARRAFALATNRGAYVAALGGTTAAEPVTSLIPEGLRAHHEEDVLAGGESGDPTRAKQLLEEAGLTPPVKIRVAYRSTPTSDAALKALVEGWQAAGFEPELQPIDKDYWTTISAPGRSGQTDVFWANWASDWPSASTVIGPVFDSRINLTDAGSGRNYGYVSDKKVDAQISKIGTIPDPAKREAAWAELDKTLQQGGCYVALAQRREFYVVGRDVRNLVVNEAAGGFIDFATIAVD